MNTQIRGARLKDLAEALHTSDAAGRLMHGAPRLHVLRTSDDQLVRGHADLAEDLVKRLVALGRKPRGRPSKWSKDYAQYLAEVSSSGPVKAIRAGMIYGFPNSLSAADGVIEIGPENASLLEGGLDEWLPDVAGGVRMVAVKVGGRAVSLCASVNATSQFHCAGVETLPVFRGQGLGAQAVAGWATMVRGMGAEPIYGTTFDNLSSQAVARRLGLIAVGSEISVY